MATTAQLKIQIQADMAQAKKDLEAINQVVAEMSPQAQLTAQSLREVDSGLSSLQSVVLGAATAFLSLQTAMQAIRVSDDYNQMASRIKMVTTSTEEYTMVQERLMQVADRTYKPISTIQELFVRSASSMRELGYSTKETVDFIDSISSSLTINSASADKSNTAIAALSKSMTTGKVAAQEWETVMNVMPTIAADIATYLRETGKEANATEQSVKNMAKDGQISMELMAASAIYAKDKVAELAEKMPTTFGDAMARLGSHLAAYLADTNNSIGATEKLVEAINFVTQHLDEFAKVVAALVAGALARYGVILVQNTLTTIKAAAAKKILIAQEVALAQAQVAATRAALTEATGHTQAMAAARAHQAALVQLAAAQKAASTVMLGMGLPGLAMTVASVAAGWLLFRDSTNEATGSLDKFGKTADEAKQKLKNLSTEQAARALQEQNKAIDTQTKKLNSAKDEILSILNELNNNSAYYGKQGAFGLNEEEVTKAQKQLYEIRKALDDGGKGAQQHIEILKQINPVYDSAAEKLTEYIAVVVDESKELDSLTEVRDTYKNKVEDDTQATDQNSKAHREFLSSANGLDGEIKKFTTSIDSNIASARTSTDVISSLETQLTTLKNTAGATPEKIDELTKSLDKLKAKQQELDNSKNEKYLTELKKENETAGMSSWDKKRYEINNNKTWTGDQKEQALAVVTKGEAQEKASKAAEKAKSTADSLAKSNLSYVQGLEKQAAALNLGKVATLEYELAQKQLSGALLERAKASIEAFRAAQQLANAKVNSGMQVELLRLTGQDYQADLLELESKFKETTEQLKKEGNTAGLEIAEQLLNTGKAKAQIDAIKKEIEKAFNKQSVAEQGIQAQVTARQISQYEGQKRLTELHKQTAAVVEQYLPELEKAAQMPGAMGEQSASYLAEVNNQLLVLKTTTNELENAFRTGLQDGLQSSVEGMIKGTMDLRDAVINLADSILTDVGNLAAQKVSEIATDKMMQLFNFSSDQSTPQATAISNASEQGAQAMKLGIEQGSQLAAQNLATAMQSNAGTATAIPSVNTQASDGVTQGVNSGLQEAVQGGDKTASTSIADSMLQAGSQVGSMLSSSLLSGGNFLQQGLMSVFQSLMSMLGGGAGGAGGLASSAASLITGAMGFSSGGRVQGAGTGTSDSIPAWLSNDEFVTQSKVVRQPGMLAFLHDLNRRGWGAVHDLTRVRHSTGGLAGIPAPSVPSPISSMVQPITNTGSATTVENAVNLHVYDDPNRIIGAATSDAGMEQYYLKVERNPQRLKSILGI